MTAAESPAARSRLAARPASIRTDLRLIAEMIEPESRVLDIGCGDGALLDYLVHFKQVVGRGLELSQAGVNACVSQGLSVVQGDADQDLSDYPDGAFDYVVLSQTLQATHDPRAVLEQLVRIGRHAIVSFPNFGYWKLRLGLLFKGRMPVTASLPDLWYETQNIHLCTILDFLELARRCGLDIERSLMLDERGDAKPLGSEAIANLTATDAVFLLKRGGTEAAR